MGPETRLRLRRREEISEAGHIMTPKKSRTVSHRDSDRDVLASEEAFEAFISQNVDLLRETAKLMNALNDSTLRLESVLYDMQPRVSHLDRFLKTLNSVFTIMPDSIAPTHPWVRDFAALKSDMAIIGRDAWTVIARHENERRRQES